MRSMVEGAARRSLGDYRVHGGLDVVENIGRRNTQNLHAVRGEERVASFVTLGPIAHFVAETVDFDGQASLSTEEIGYEWTCGVLPPKLEAVGTSAKLLPELHLGQAQPAPQATCKADRRGRPRKHPR